MKRYRLSAPAAVVAGGCVTVAAIAWFSMTAYPLSRALFIVCPGIAFTAMLVSGSDSMIERMRDRIKVALVPAGLWTLYLVYSWGMGIANPTAALTMAVYLSVPFIVLGLWPAAEPIVILWIWLPLEFGVIREFLIVRAPGGDVHYAFAQLLALDAGIIAFVVWRRVANIGYRFEWDGRIVRSGLTNFLWFALIGIPLGFAIHFIQYTFEVRKLMIALPAFAGIFLLTALPEEFLFRGLIQNWLERVTGRRTVSLLIAAVIFGSSHLNNGLPQPNYRYFLMATIAGVFYGRAWRGTRSLMASSLTHALVDTCWTVMFR